MRTTLTLPDDLYQMVRSHARTLDVSLGDAVADLVRRGLRPASTIETGSAFPCFHLPGDAEPITLEHALQVEDDQ